MDLSAFNIRQAVFEIRYDQAYLLWDRAGATTAAIRKVWPDLRVRQAEPNEQILENDEVVVLTGIQTSYIALVRPNSILAFRAQMEATLRIWIELLNIERFSRVGTRVIYSNGHASKAAVSDALLGLNLVKVPSAPFFNHKGPPSALEFKLTWDDDVSTTQVSIRPEHSDIEIKPVAGSSMKSQKETTDDVILDIDRAAKGTIDISKFSLTSWLEGVQHLIARDIKQILGGK